jgi:uncharacterized membrane protein HdeD (DUF308 family)
MSVLSETSMREALNDEIRSGARRFVVLGVLTLALGAFGLFYAGLMSVTSVLAFGAALVVGGVIHLVHAVQHRDAVAFLLQIPVGILDVVVGLLVLSKPGATLAGLTLLLAGFFIVSGVVRCVMTLLLRFPGWGWTFASGIASLFLGALVWSEWPSSSYALLGTMISAYLIMIGYGYLMFGIFGTRLSKELTGGSAPQPG